MTKMNIHRIISQMDLESHPNQNLFLIVLEWRWLNVVEKGLSTFSQTHESPSPEHWQKSGCLRRQKVNHKSNKGSKD